MSWILGFWILTAVVTVGWLLYEARKPIDFPHNRENFIQRTVERQIEQRRVRDEIQARRQEAARKGWETRRRKQQELLDRRSWAYPYDGIYTVNVTTGHTKTVTEPEPEKAKRIYLEEDES